MDWVGVAIGTLAGGATLFVWYSICWMVLPHHKKDFRPFPKSEAVESGLRENALAPGLYCLPHVTQFEGMSDPALAERMKEGPNALVTVLPNGPPMSGATFARALAINLLGAFSIAMLLAWQPEMVIGLGSTALFCAACGLFTVVTAHFTQSNWMGVPWSLAFKHLFDDGVGFALVGVVMHFLGPGVVTG